jgi:hypothetical protein
LLAAATARGSWCSSDEDACAAQLDKLVGSATGSIFSEGALPGALHLRSFAYEPVSSSMSNSPYPIAFPLHLRWTMVNSDLFTGLCTVFTTLCIVQVSSEVLELVLV